MVAKQVALAVAALTTMGNMGTMSNNTAPFTPVDMLTAPRPQAAIAAPGGKHALSVVDQWDDKNDVTTRTVYLLEPANAGAHPHKLFSAPPKDAKEFVWLSPTVAAYINGSSLLHFSIRKEALKDWKTMHTLDFPKGIEPSGLQYEPKSHTLAFSAAVWGPDASLEDTETGDKKFEKRGDSALVFDDLFVRHWDTWRTPGRVYTLAATTLNRTKKKDEDNEDVFVQEKREWIYPLKGTGLYSQMDPISQFTLSPTHVAVGLKPPSMNPATHTRVDVYLLPLHSTGRFATLTTGAQGAVASLKFSPDFSKLVWLEMAKDGYESDRNVVMVHDVGRRRSERWTDEWDRSPSSITWAVDSGSLYLLAETQGRVLPYHLSTPGRLPTPVLFHGSTSSITPLTTDTMLLAVSSIQSPTEIVFLDFVEGPGHDPDKVPPEELRKVTHYSEKHIDGRLDESKPERFWFEGEDGRQVMAWIIKPRGWVKGEEKKWPMAFLIHGGPQGAWTDSWSTRWNPALYAQAGYFTVAVNPTGSTGYGQDFTDRIAEHWGDRPFQDLLLGYRAVLEKYPEIDAERTAALGASYGGYMVNWINGHNEFGFKCLVYHDGIFDTSYSFYATEEVYFPTHDFGGALPANRDMFEKWSPMNHVQEWKTPQLVIQGGKDFRLDESQAIATFTALQLQGVPSRFVYFPDENHWVLKASNSRRWHAEVFNWLDKWVGHDAGKELAN